MNSFVLTTNINVGFENNDLKTHLKNNSTYLCKMGQKVILNKHFLLRQVSSTRLYFPIE